MSTFTGNEIIHQYLRHNKKFPHVLCAGCGHGIVLGTLIRSIHALEIPKDDVVVVAGIGCSGRLAVYVDFNTIHTTHGRALSFATGIKMANPKLNVITIMGDGDALSIGGNHLIHAARRNIGVTALVLNNSIYGMTGGQSSPATPLGSTTMTNPYGQLDSNFDTVELARGAGANYVARGTVFHVNKLEKIMTEAIQRPGFSVVEAITPCHTQYGRKNKFKNPVEMYKWMKKTAISVERYAELPEDKRAGRLPIGVFVERNRPGFEESYAQLRSKLQAKGGK
ncbi:2-oxoacid:ferredoxin oxidoreductase subunit beta [Pseudodesulfovibrio sp. JC047]|uniref:2-oxoacid:ferredoxin oxidoreductase subunit beta n=1 Tax=Pseudodesulfovibrio sp. JC047 TaxID=2683199 RepID=UPI0013D8DB63|nr:2-oxoacid:ferredoxin oxidoreductase subunit beta [Pseudodesulfovibrio sp. JC047]NDV18726.1 2-oxoacid:ferredoxin oxidoreductase subunit beta [Pseudodesulfovibrio sp. JC047]